jgi:hypothetical protein
MKSIDLDLWTELVFIKANSIGCIPLDESSNLFFGSDNTDIQAALVTSPSKQDRHHKFS